MKRAVIGEGAYGCVHNPSLQCIDPPKPNFDYKNYVSKIMKTRHARTELNEFVVIQKLDPKDEYHLGVPEICKPKLNDDIKKDIAQCKNIKVNDIEENPDSYSLLILKFGGPDLKSLCNDFLAKYLSTNKTKKIDKFLFEIHHLLKGLKFFKENGIVHNDIKPQNILFDQKTGRMKYIDFGLMRKKIDIINASTQNVNALGVYHWSYPFDCGTMNKNIYNKYKRLDREERHKWKEELSNLIITDSHLNTFNLPIRKPKAFQILFTYLNPLNILPNANTQYSFVDSFFDGFNELIESKNYEEILDITADSIDIFGLGFSMQFMINCLKRIDAFNIDFFVRLTTFFHKMYDFNPKTREIDIDVLIEEYENILLQLGVLTRLKKRFENHSSVNKSPIPMSIMKESRVDDNSQPKYLSKELDYFANKDAIKINITCPEGTEMKPSTKRCIKKCKDGFQRDKKFNCKKTHKLRSISFKRKNRNRHKSKL
jgi:serine/threonine protein kinase